MAETEDRIVAIENSVKSLADAINALVPILSKSATAQKGLNATYLEAQDALETYIRMERKLKEAAGGMAAASEADRKKLAALKTAVAEYTANAMDAKKATDELAKEMKRLAEAAEAPKTALGKIGLFGLTAAKGVGALGKGLMETLNVGSKYAQMMGATAVSLQVMVDRTAKYNASMFTLSKTSRLMGGGLGDMGKTFKSVRDNTTLSKNQFLDLANSVNKTYLGVKPLPAEIGKFAARIQKSFGPDFEVAKQASQELIGIQRQFPPLFDTIARAHDKMASAQKSGSQEMLKEAYGDQAAALGMMLGLDFDPSQIETAMQAMEPMTEEEAKQVELNKKMAEATQASEDAILAAGKAGEEAMKNWADMATKAYEIMEKYPKSIFASVVAVNALSSAMAIFAGFAGTGLIAKSLLKQTGATSAISKSFKIAAARVAGSAATGATAAATGATAAATGATAAATGATAAPAVAGAAAASTAIAAAWVTGAAVVGVGAGMAIDRFWGVLEKAFGYSGERLSSRLGDLIENTWIGRLATKGIDKGTETDQGQIDKQKAIRGEQEQAEKAGKGPEWRKLFKEKKAAGMEEVVAARQARVELEKGLQSQDKALSNHNKIASGMKKSTLEYLNQVKTLEQSLSIHMKILAAIRGQISANEEVFAVTQKMMDQQFQSSKATVEDLKNYANNTLKELEAPVTGIVGEPVKLGVGSDEAEKYKDAAEKLQKYQEKLNSFRDLAKAKMEASPEDQKPGNALFDAYKTAEAKASSLSMITSKVSEKHQAFAQATTDQAKAFGGSYRQQGDQLKAMNRLEQERLEAQRSVYETSMMGFGASVEMLQKQVDLEYEMLSISQQQLDKAKERAKTEYGIGAEVMDQIASAKNGSEAKAAIDAEAAKHRGKEEDVAKALSQYYKDAKGLVTDRLKSEQKILELTKSMREGYLDAIREDSTNFGEFSKIISTRSMGVTSMMASVKQATGENKLNTMAVGGVAERGSAGWLARTGMTGQYTLGGPKFANEALNNRWGTLHRGKESQQMLENIKAGRPAGVNPGSVGGAQLSQAGDYAGAQREIATSEEVAKKQADAVENLTKTTETENDKLIKEVKNLPLNIAKEMALLSKASQGIIGPVRAGNAPGQEARGGEGAKTALAAGTAYLNAAGPITDEGIAAQETARMDAEKKRRQSQPEPYSKEAADAMVKDIDNALARGEAAILKENNMGLPSPEELKKKYAELEEVQKQATEASMSADKKTRERGESLGQAAYFEQQIVQEQMRSLGMKEAGKEANLLAINESNANPYPVAKQKKASSVAFAGSFGQNFASSKKAGFGRKFGGAGGVRGLTDMFPQSDTDIGRTQFYKEGGVAGGGKLEIIITADENGKLTTRLKDDAAFKTSIKTAASTA